MDTSTLTTGVINAHLERCGAQSGNSAIICRPGRSGAVTITDGCALWTGAHREALRRLESLPDGCGWASVWEAFND